MSIAINIEEVFDMAVQLEKNGAEFYSKAAENTSEKTLHNFLLDLAAMEREHEKIFEQIKKETVTEMDKSSYFDPYDEAVLYLKAFVNGHVFDVKGDPAILIKGNETAEEIIRTAINLEKDSIIFYLGLKDAVRKDVGRDKIDIIIREEMKHIRDLSESLENIATDL